MKWSPRQLARGLRDWSVDDLCRLTDPFDAGWETILYAPQVTTGAYDLAADDAEALRHGLDVAFHRRWLLARRLRLEGVLQLVSGEPLSSEARTPFELDGRAYVSVASFYDALKFREDDPAREAVAMGRFAGPRRRIRRPPDRGSFTYLGKQIAVGSPEHAALIGRATEAKVHAHASVRRALAATGRSRLFMGARFGLRPQMLGRTMPFALMVLRHRLGTRGPL